MTTIAAGIISFLFTPFARFGCFVSRHNWVSQGITRDGLCVYVSHVKCRACGARRGATA